MKQLLLIALLASMALSGCVGYPEGTIAPGDTVIGEFTVTNAAGQEIVPGGLINFRVASGNSGLGIQFERALVGEAGNQTLTIQVSDDDSLAFREPVAVDAVFGPQPLQDQIDRNTFEQAFGEPVEGETFSPPGFFSYRVVTVEESTVTYEIIVADGEEHPVPQLGAILVARVGEDGLTNYLKPDVGAEFRIQPPRMGQQTPLGLPAGSYQVVGGEEGRLDLLRSASIYAAALPESFTVTFRISQHVPANADVDTVQDGNYGMRRSPYLNGQPQIVDLEDVAS